ncbi:hypothetical protein ACGVWS_09820 [Enterobacteriaceae bacterium LUAb1]
MQQSIVVKKRFGYPAVIENLICEAQDEDYRREQMAAFERSARSHFYLSDKAPDG